VPGGCAADHIVVAALDARRALPSDARLPFTVVGCRRRKGVRVLRRILILLLLSFAPGATAARADANPATFGGITGFS
jgi:hypothetical protein